MAVPMNIPIHKLEPEPNSSGFTLYAAMRLRLFLREFEPDGIEPSPAPANAVSQRLSPLAPAPTIFKPRPK
jgi:hypothetical protein